MNKFMSKIIFSTAFMAVLMAAPCLHSMSAGQLKQYPTWLDWYKANKTSGIFMDELQKPAVDNASLINSTASNPITAQTITDLSGKLCVTPKATNSLSLVVRNANNNGRYKSAAKPGLDAVADAVKALNVEVSKLKGDAALVNALTALSTKLSTEFLLVYGTNVDELKAFDGVQYLLAQTASMTTIAANISGRDAQAKADALAKKAAVAAVTVQPLKVAEVLPVLTVLPVVPVVPAHTVEPTQDAETKPLVEPKPKTESHLGRNAVIGATVVVLTEQAAKKGYLGETAQEAAKKLETVIGNVYTTTKDAVLGTEQPTTTVAPTVVSTAAVVPTVIESVLEQRDVVPTQPENVRPVVAALPIEQRIKRKPFSSMKPIEEVDSEEEDVVEAEPKETPEPVETQPTRTAAKTFASIVAQSGKYAEQSTAAKKTPVTAKDIKPTMKPIVEVDPKDELSFDGAATGGPFSSDAQLEKDAKSMQPTRYATPNEPKKPSFASVVKNAKQQSIDAQLADALAQKPASKQLSKVTRVQPSKKPAADLHTEESEANESTSCRIFTSDTQLEQDAKSIKRAQYATLKTRNTKKNVREIAENPYALLATKPATPDIAIPPIKQETAVPAPSISGRAFVAKITAPLTTLAGGAPANAETISQDYTTYANNFDEAVREDRNEVKKHIQALNDKNKELYEIILANIKKSSLGKTDKKEAQTALKNYAEVVRMQLAPIAANVDAENAPKGSRFWTAMKYLTIAIGATALVGQVDPLNTHETSTAMCPANSYVYGTMQPTPMCSANGPGSSYRPTDAEFIELFGLEEMPAKESWGDWARRLFTASTDSADSLEDAAINPRYKKIDALLQSAANGSLLDSGKSITVIDGLLGAGHEYRAPELRRLRKDQVKLLKRKILKEHEILKEREERLLARKSKESFRVLEAADKAKRTAEETSPMYPICPTRREIAIIPAADQMQLARVEPSSEGQKQVVECRADADRLVAVVATDDQKKVAVVTPNKWGTSPLRLTCQFTREECMKAIKAGEQIGPECMIATHRNFHGSHKRTK